MNNELQDVSRIGAAPRPEYAYVPLVQQRAAVVRELGMRNRVYPKWIDSGRMKPAEAAHQLAAMQCVLDTIDLQGELVAALRAIADQCDRYSFAHVGDMHVADFARSAIAKTERKP